MVETNFTLARILQPVKKLIHFCLFSAFLVFAILGLIDLLSGQTTFLVSRVSRPVSLPSFTICLHGHNHNLDKNLLSQGTLTKEKFPFALQTRALLQSKEDARWVVADLLDADDLKSQLNSTIDESWERHCKIYPPRTNLDSCTPCLSFRNPSLIGGDFASAMVNECF